MARGFYLKNPTPIGSRPRDLIGLCETTRETRPPHHTRRGKEGKETPTGEKGQRGRGGERTDFFKRETEHLCLRQLIHGTGRDPFARA